MGRWAVGVPVGPQPRYHVWYRFAFSACWHEDGRLVRAAGLRPDGGAVLSDAGWSERGEVEENRHPAAPPSLTAAPSHPREETTRVQRHGFFPHISFWEVGGPSLPHPRGCPTFWEVGEIEWEGGSAPPPPSKRTVPQRSRILPTVVPTYNNFLKFDIRKFPLLVTWQQRGCGEGPRMLHRATCYNCGVKRSLRHQTAAAVGQGSTKNFPMVALRSFTLDELSAAEMRALMARPRVDFTAIMETARLASHKARRVLKPVAGASYRGVRASSR